MQKIFGAKQKSPGEIVKGLREAVEAVAEGRKADKAQEEVTQAFSIVPIVCLLMAGLALKVARGLTAVKGVLYGSEGGEPQTELVAQLAQEAYNSNLIPLLVTNLPKLDFESKKVATSTSSCLPSSLLASQDVALVFNNLLRRQIGTRSPTVEYLSTRPEILINLMKGYSYESPEIALNCGSMVPPSFLFLTPLVPLLDNGRHRCGSAAGTSPSPR